MKYYKIDIQGANNRGLGEESMFVSLFIFSLSTPCSLASREGRKEILRMQPAMRRTALFVEGEGEEEERGANDDGDEEKRENR
jgi:hypothetical protein